MEIRQELYEKEKTVSAAHALATAYYNAAVFFKDKALMKNAFELWKELSERHPEYVRYRDRAGAMAE